MKRCGECANAWPIVGDLTKRICRGAPPQLVVIQGPALAGQVQIQITPMYPNVHIGDIACGAFRPANKRAEMDAIAPADPEEGIDLAALAKLRKQPEGSY